MLVADKSIHNLLNQKNKIVCPEKYSVLLKLTKFGGKSKLFEKNWNKSQKLYVCKSTCK